MACAHDNPSGHNFCSQCGEPIAHINCSCGFSCGSHDLFCGRCGTRLENINENSATAQPDHSGRINLRELITSIQSDHHGSQPSSGVSQDDIARLLTQANKDKH